MNEQISWDHSLVNKYSSSNHFKLLNQLRNEIKKYPLNKKKNISSDLSNQNNLHSNNICKNENSQDLSLNQNSKMNNELNNSKSNISFNNSKNFSIYKNHTNDNTAQQQEDNSREEKQANQEETSLTFKDRLNKIDMK